MEQARLHPIQSINIIGITVIAVGATWTAEPPSGYTLGLIPSGSGDTELVSFLAAPQGDFYDSLAGGAGNTAVPFIATSVSDPAFLPLVGSAFGDFIFAAAVADGDNDGIADAADNCPAVANPSQSNIDGDSNGDVCDICPADNTNTCNPDGSAAGEITVASGGTIATPDGHLTIVIDPGDLAADSTVSATQTTISDPNVNLSINALPGAGRAIAFYDLEPNGLQFANAVTLTILADVTGLVPSIRDRIDLYRFEDTNADGTPDTFVSLDASCSINEDPIGTFIATCSAQVDHFSTYAIIVPSDLDDDGVPDNFDGFGDNCTLVSNTDQRDTNGDGFGNVCDADFNGDFTVNLSDYSVFRSKFGTADPDADFNGDGVVNLSDYSIFRAAFGKAPGPSCCAP